MKTAWKTMALSACMFLVTVAAVVLTDPVPASAVTCFTECADGSEVSCTGDSCTETPGVGATCYSNGIKHGARCDAAIQEESQLEQ